MSDPEGTIRECSICGSEFDLKGEGGMDGYFGISYVAFCPWCYASMADMFEQTRCAFCEHYEKDDDGN